jgi:hypothetical protein
MMLDLSNCKGCERASDDVRNQSINRFRCGIPGNVALEGVCSNVSCMIVYSWADQVAMLRKGQV